jgi:hypothetical protein
MLVIFNITYLSCIFKKLKLKKKKEEMHQFGNYSEVSFSKTKADALKMHI